METLEKLWNWYKTLKWYYKVLLFIPIVTILAAIYCFFFVFSKDKINLKILNRNKESTDTFVNNFEKNEIVEEREREILNQKKEVLEEKVNVIEETIKKKEEKHEEILWKIDNANNDQLRSLFSEVRERGRKN